MKRYFITGLALLLPLTLTIMIVLFLVNFLTDPFVDVVKSVMDHYEISFKGFWILSEEQIQRAVSQVLILTTLFGATTILGFFTRWVFVHYFIRLGDYILHRIPFFNTIYKTTQEVIKTIFITDTRSFKQVVMVPFPYKGSKTIGLVTQENLENINEPDRIAVFVPTTPNPTSGYLVLLKREDVVFLDMKIEDALKYVISCGVIQTDITAMPLVEEPS